MSPQDSVQLEVMQTISLGVEETTAQDADPIVTEVVLTMPLKPPPDTVIV